MPVAACQTCSCRDRRLCRNEDPQNGHYEPCRFDKHDQILQTTAVTCLKLIIISNLLIRDALEQPNATLLVKRLPLLQSEVLKCREFEQNSCQSAVTCFESQRFKDVDFQDSGWFPPRRVDHHVLLPNEENDSHWPGGIGDRIEMWTAECTVPVLNTLPRCLRVIDVVFLFANRP